MTDEQSKHREILTIRELLARFGVGAIIGGAIALCYWLYIASYSEDGQKQQQNLALPGFYYLRLVVV